MANAEFYTVKVHGEYCVQSGNERILRGYEATFRLPDATKPLSVIAGKLLGPFLRKKDKEFTSIYTHIIDEISYSGRVLDPNEIPVRFQTKEQLDRYIQFHKLQINTNDYASLGVLREHVRLAKEDPNGFKKASDKYIQTMASDKMLHELNEGLLDDVVVKKPVAIVDGGQVPEKPVQPTKTAKKPLPRKRNRPSRAKSTPNTTKTPQEPTEPTEDSDPGDLLK